MLIPLVERIGNFFHRWPQVWILLHHSLHEILQGKQAVLHRRRLLAINKAKEAISNLAQAPDIGWMTMCLTSHNFRRKLPIMNPELLLDLVRALLKAEGKVEASNLNLCNRGQSITSSVLLLVGLL